MAVQSIASARSHLKKVCQGEMFWAQNNCSSRRNVTAQIAVSYRLRNIFPAAMSLHGSVRQFACRSSLLAGLSFQFVA